MPMPGRTRRDEVVTISGARRSHTEDYSQRVRTYLISMAIRTASVILLVVVPKPWGWLFLLTAVFLPYFAVVGGNAVDQRGEGHVAGWHDPQRLLESGEASEESHTSTGGRP